MKRFYFSSLASVLWSIGIEAVPSPISDQIEARGVNDNGITFDCTIPSLKTALPIFSLGAAAQFPFDKLSNILEAASPGITRNVTKGSDGSLSFYDGDLLVGFFNRTSNETFVFPKLELLKPADSLSIANLSSFIKGDETIIPTDDTQHSIVIGSRLSGSSQPRDGQASSPADYLLEGLVQRSIPYSDGVYPVCGPGSQGSFHFNAAGAIAGLTHTWKAARNLGPKLQPITQDTIQGTINATLTAANITANVTVRAIDLCFYDSGNRYIQPVFRYNATLSHPFGADELLVGYIPAGGKEIEGLPSLIGPSGDATPTFSSTSTISKLSRSLKRLVARSVSFLQKRASINVGRYAMSHDQYSPQIVVDENAFWAGLRSVSSSFVNGQYFWSEEFEFESNAEQFVDTVDLAFTEGHGDVHLFWTNELKADWGPVHISDDLPAAGYGAGAGGRLSYWIIRACLTVSSPKDYPAGSGGKAFDPWWKVFNGMHAVMGYRSLAQVYDNEMGKVGKVLAQGQSAVHGWMNAAKGGGKTSAVVVCGHSDDTVYNVANLGRPGCLQIWWLN